jgi:hypothetical protein
LAKGCGQPILALYWPIWQYKAMTRVGAVIVEECEGELRLKPAAVLEVARYSDAQIAAWDRADVLSAAERQAILQRLLQE